MAYDLQFLLSQNLQWTHNPRFIANICVILANTSIKRLLGVSNHPFLDSTLFFFGSLSKQGFGIVGESHESEIILFLIIFYFCLPFVTCLVCILRFPAHISLAPRCMRRKTHNHETSNKIQLTSLEKYHFSHQFEIKSRKTAYHVKLGCFLVLMIPHTCIFIHYRPGRFNLKHYFLLTDIIL